MGHIRRYNFNKYNLRLSNADYWDFYLSSDDIYGYPINTCLPSVTFDFNNKNTYLNEDFNPNTIKSLTSWEGAINSGVTLNTVGLTGIDNGFITFVKDPNDLSNQALLSAMTDSSLVISSGDTRLYLTRVTGQTNDIIYPIDIISGATSGSTRYAQFCGGFFQGYYKLDGYDYEVLPTRVNDSWSSEFWLIKQDVCDEYSGTTLNDLYPNNKGIFFYLGTRAENKFWNIWEGTDTGCTSGCTIALGCADECLIPEGLTGTSYSNLFGFTANTNNEIISLTSNNISFQNAYNTGIFDNVLSGITSLSSGSSLDFCNTIYNIDDNLFSGITVDNSKLTTIQTQDELVSSGTTTWITDVGFGGFYYLDTLKVTGNYTKKLQAGSLIKSTYIGRFDELLDITLPIISSTYNVLDNTTEITPDWATYGFIPFCKNVSTIPNQSAYLKAITASWSTNQFGGVFFLNTITVPTNYVNIITVGSSIKATYIDAFDTKTEITFPVLSRFYDVANDVTIVTPDWTAYGFAPTCKPLPTIPNQSAFITTITFGQVSGVTTSYSSLINKWCTIPKESEVSIIGDYGIEIPLDPPQVEIKLIENPFLIYGRNKAIDFTSTAETGTFVFGTENNTTNDVCSKCGVNHDGLGGRVICSYDGNGIAVVKTSERITNNTNPFLVYGRSKGTKCDCTTNDDGYGQNTICDFSGFTSPITELDYNHDIIDNALAFIIKDNGSIGYRLLTYTGGCVTTATGSEYISGVTVEEQFSEAGVIEDNEWKYVVIKFITDYKDDCELQTFKRRKGKLLFYVDTKLKFVVDEFDEFIARRLNEYKDKQIGVPFNMSLGGGSQGLLESVTFDGLDPNDRGLPIEENFAGSFIGGIKSFKFNVCRLTYEEMVSNYNSGLVTGTITKAPSGFFYGKFPTTSINSADILSLTFTLSNGIVNNSVNFTSGVNSYAYIIIPMDFQQPSEFRNSDEGCKGFTIPVLTLGTVTIPDANDFDVKYIIYRTFNRTNGSLDMWFCD